MNFKEVEETIEAEEEQEEEEEDGEDGEEGEECRIRDTSLDQINIYIKIVYISH